MRYMLPSKGERMTYKAKISFGGIISMVEGQTAEIADPAIAKDLLKAGYIVEVKPAEKGKTAKSKENKKPTKARAKRGNPKGG